MIGWIIAACVGAAWLGVTYGPPEFRLILRTSLPVPLSYLVSYDVWHSKFCSNGHVSKCKEVTTLPISTAMLQDIAPKALFDRAIIAVEEIISTADGWSMVNPIQQASFSCCWVGSPHEFGYVLAQSSHFIITLEVATPNDNILRLACSSKRHCIAPPMIPFGRTVWTASRANASWPDHYHFWLVEHALPRARIESNEVAIWDKTEVPWGPLVSYSVVTALKRAITPLPVYRFDQTALNAARRGLMLSQSDTNDELSRMTQLEQRIELLTGQVLDLDERTSDYDELKDDLNDAFHTIEGMMDDSDSEEEIVSPETQVVGPNSASDVNPGETTSLIASLVAQQIETALVDYINQDTLRTALNEYAHEVRNIVLGFYRITSRAPLDQKELIGILIDRLNMNDWRPIQYGPKLKHCVVANIEDWTERPFLDVLLEPNAPWASVVPLVQIFRTENEFGKYSFVSFRPRERAQVLQLTDYVTEYPDDLIPI